MKSSLRKYLRAKRRALSAAEHALRSRSAALVIGRLAAFKRGGRVAVYAPFDGETDTSWLLAEARRRGVRLFVPVVADRRRRIMRFHPLSKRTTRGAFGIPVPHRPGRAVPARWLDLIVVPLVGVDRDGRRLGMGGGFYDRALSFRLARRPWMGPQVVGFCFDCQRTDAAFAEPWDVRLDGVATESGLERFPTR